METWIRYDGRTESNYGCWHAKVLGSECVDTQKYHAAWLGDTRLQWRPFISRILPGIASTSRIRIQHNGSNLASIHGLNWGSQFRRGIRHAQLRAREKTCANQYTSRPLLRQHVRGWPKGTTTNHRNNLFLPGPCGVPAGVAEGAARATSSIVSPPTCSTCLTCPIVQNDMYATTMYMAAPEH